MIKEKPILFSGAMVRAILEGRKTMTRRIMKPQPLEEDGSIYSGKIHNPEYYEPFLTDKYGEEISSKEVFGIYSDNGEWGVKCPYEPGMILWVRETWVKQKDGSIIYRASSLNENIKWKPSLFMRRENARILLKIKDVRAERLMEITDDDAKAEGIVWDEYGEMLGTGRKLFFELWDSLNEKRGYGLQANPWVYVINFEVIK